MSTQYYGPHTVIAAREDDDLVTLTLEQPAAEGVEVHQYEKVVPRFLYEKIVSDTQKDWNYVQETKLSLLSKDVINLCIRYHLTGGEVKAFLQKFGMDFYTIIDRAVNLQFLGDDHRFVPGGDLYYEFTLNRAHEITKHLDDRKES